MTESGGAAQSLLPIDISVPTPEPMGSTGYDKHPTAPSFGEVARRAAPHDDPSRWFSKTERATAAWLHSRGVDVLSVERREGHSLKTPDAVAADAPITIEIKRAIGSVNSVVQRIRQARWQARHVVVDLRGTGTTRATAEDALRRALIRYQQDLNEVTIVVADELSVGWTHG